MSLVLPKRFVLMDRDGTINVERHYLGDPAGLELYPSVGEALRRFAGLGLGMIVVTNQSGIGRGYFDAATVELIHLRLKEMLGSEGVTLDGIYICPHVASDNCRCRKPGTGMVEMAVADFGFDPKQSFLVGDKSADIGLAHAVGAKAILVRTGWGKKTEDAKDCSPDVILDDLGAASVWIEGCL